MSKIVTEEFDACHKFFDEVLLTCSRLYGIFSMAHNVSDNEFAIFIEFNPEFNINEMIN